MGTVGIRTVYALLPYVLFYFPDNGEWFAGRAYGPVVKIKRKYKDDKGLLWHEEEHVRQFYKTLGLHGLLYKFVRRYRAWAEATAYARQVEGGADLARMALAMSKPENYDLEMTQAEARRAIQQHL